MIRCASCGKLWPQGTVWCGTCRKTLGKRLCPAGHESPIDANTCTMCGSSKLTPATGSQNLRPVTWLVTVIGCLAVYPCVSSFFGAALKTVWCWLLNAVLPILVTLAFFSFLLSLFVGDRGRKAISDLWILLARSFGQILAVLCQLVVSLISRMLKKQ